MKFRFSFFSAPLPEGYSIVKWSNTPGEKRYSLFWGDDRLMSFTSKAEARKYAVEIDHKTRVVAGSAGTALCL